MVGLTLSKLNYRESISKLNESMHYSGENLVTTYFSRLQEQYNRLYAERIINTIVNESCISNADFKILEETFNMLCENEENPQYIAYVGRAIVEAVPKVRTGAQLLTNIKMRTRKFKTKVHTNFYKNINKMKSIGADTVNAAKTNFKNNTGIGSSNTQVNKKDQEKLEEVVTAYENIENAYREAMIIDSMISNYNKISKQCNPIEVVKGTNVQEAVVEMADLLDRVGINLKGKTRLNATIETTLMAFTKFGKNVDPVEITEAVLNHYFVGSNNMMYEVADALSTVRILESKDKDRCFDTIFGDITQLDLDKIKYPTLIQEDTKATNVKDLMAELRKDENLNASKFKKVMMKIFSQDPEDVINGMPDIFKFIRQCIVIAPLFIPFGILIWPILYLVDIIIDNVVAVPRYKKAMKYIDAELDEVDKEIDKCKDKDKLKQLIKYKSNLETGKRKLGTKIWGVNYTMMTDSSNFVHDYDDLAVTQLRAMVEDSKKSSNGKSFDDVLSSFKKETSKTPERFKSLLTSFYVQKPEDVVNEVPNILGAVRMFFVVGGTTAINPILGLVTLVADYAVKMHLTRKQYEKYISNMEKELEKTKSKLEKVTNDNTKERLTAYKKELEKNIEKLKEKEDDLYTDEENEKRKPSDISIDSLDDDFNFDDDFSFDEAANLVVTLEKAVSNTYKLNIKDTIHKATKAITKITTGAYHPNLKDDTLDDVYTVYFNRGELHKYAVSRSYTSMYSDDVPIRDAADFYVQMVAEGISDNTKYAYPNFLIDGGKKYTCAVIYDEKSLEYRAVFALLKRNSFHGELYWLYCQDSDPRLLEPISIDIEEKSKLKESPVFANSNTYGLTELILNMYKDSDTGTLRELLSISKLCPEFIDWDTLREQLDSYYHENYIPIRYIPDIQESNRRAIIKEFIDESNIERPYNTNLYEVANRYGIICPIVQELCITSSNTLLQEMDITNTFKMAKENLKRSIKGLSDKEKSLSRNIDVSMNQVSRAAEKALTNDNREAVIRGSLLPSASKIIKMAIVTGAGWLINPALTVIGVLGAIGVSKKLEAKERQLILDDIEIELDMCDRYMKIAEDKNDLKSQKDLLVTKRTLERQRQRIKYKMSVYHNQNVGNLKTNGSNDDDI